MNSTKHLKRWIVASFLQELKPLADGMPIYKEGDDNLNNQKNEHFELRIDGPYVRPSGTKSQRCAYIEVNILATSSRNVQDRFRRESLQGLMQSMLDRDICIKRTGNEGRESVDDGQVVGIMQLLPVDQIKVSDFGQIDTATQVYQAVAEAHYEMHFTLTLE